MAQGNLKCKFSFISWNIRSLKKRYIDILHYVKVNKPSVVCLQEPLTNTKPFTIRGYTKYDHPTGQGLTTYISNTTPHEFVECSDNNNVNNMYMLFKINDNEYPFYICNTYIRPNHIDTDKLPNCYTYRRIMYIGDFNARHKTLEAEAKAKTNSNEVKFLKFITYYSIRIHNTPKETRFWR